MGGQFKRGTPRRGRHQRGRQHAQGRRAHHPRRLRVRARRTARRRVHMADKSNAMRHAHELWYRVLLRGRAGVPGHRGEARLRRRALPATSCRTRRSSRSSSPATSSATSSPTSAPRCRAGSGWRRARTCTRPALLRAAHAGAAWHVRAGPRLGAAARRQGPREPARERAHGGDDARPPRLARGGARLERLVARAIAEGKCTRDVGGELGTRAVGDWVVGELARDFD